MSILCDGCSHKSVCSHTKDFEKIIDKIDNIKFITSAHVADTKYLSDFEWFSYSPYCKYYEYQDYSPYLEMERNND